MIDFSKAIEELNSYKGSEKKKTLIYEKKKYLVKFPDPIREKNKNISYINNAYSEYIGSHIFEMIGIDAQNTVLGTYTYNGREKIVCACEDFIDVNHVLYEFENLALSANPDKKIETELEDIIEIINEVNNLTQMELHIVDNLKEKFFEMFIVDSLIGNTDRHNGNWGILVNKKSSEARFSPIYDCGSCLNPILEDSQIEKIEEAELKNLAINCCSCIKENGKKINYMTYITRTKNEECNKALKNIFKKISVDEIASFIDNVPCITAVRKEFYKKIIRYRYDILKSVYNKLVQ